MRITCPTHLILLNIVTLIIIIIIIIIENQRFKLYWDREVRTDIRVSANRPDILLYDKEKKEVDLINIAVPLSHNIQNMYAQKINKYAELATEIQQMWNVQKINIRPMAISATGIVPQHLETQLSELEITQLLTAIQRSVLLDTCHIVRKFLCN
jgi:ABC-type anion transport system duplicated permease subunit